MKKWIIPIMFVLMISVAHAGFFTSVEGGINQTRGFFAGVNAWFTTTACIENWDASYSACLTNDTRLKIYTDLNACGTYLLVPADNGTFSDYCNYCSYNLIVEDITSCLEYDGNKTHNVSIYDANYAACCNVTGLASDCYEDDSVSINKTYFETQVCRVKFSVYPLAIALFIVSLMFWFIYTANKINTKTEEGETVPLNSLIKMVMYGFAMFLSYIAMQLAYGYAVSQQLSDIIKNTLNVPFQLYLRMLQLLLFILTVGVIGNLGVRAMVWLKERYKLR